MNSCFLTSSGIVIELSLTSSGIVIELEVVCSGEDTDSQDVDGAVEAGAVSLTATDALSCFSCSPVGYCFCDGAVVVADAGTAGAINTRRGCDAADTALAKVVSVEGCAIVALLGSSDMTCKFLVRISQ